MNLPSFQHITPALRLYSGADSLAQLPRELDRLGARRAVIFCGGSLARQGTLIDLIKAAIGERCAGVFSGVKAHSPVPSVEAAARELRHHGADAVIAVGGGSAIVTARAASIVMAENNDARLLCTTLDASGKLISPKLNAPKIPQLVIPTSPTTASVKAGSAVFDPVDGKRLALFDPKTRAQAVFLHPDFLATAPGNMLLGSGMATFTLALEGLTSRTGDPISDALLMHSLRLLAKNLPDLSSHDDPLVRGELSMAAILCGQGTDYTGAGITTVIGHAIGARHELDNGIVEAVVLPHGQRFNGEAAKAGLPKVAAALGVTAVDGQYAEGVAQACETLRDAIGAPKRLRDMGIPQESLGELADLGMLDWFLRGNPRPVKERAELLRVIEAAW